MDIVILVVVTVAIVVGVGWLIVFRLMKGSQAVVPDVADERAARSDRVVALDDQGRPVTEADDAPADPPGDAVGFEKVLAEGLDDLHPRREE